MALERKTAVALRQVPVTPSDTDTLPLSTVALIIITPGDVSITDRFENTIVYEDVPAYTTFEDFSPLRVNATGTTATTIIAWREF